mgnify:CR=1 FL=1|jgi:hypothetical protein
MKERMALLMDEFANDEPGILIILQIGSMGNESGDFSPNVEKQIKYTMIRVNKEAMYIIPFMSEFEMLSMTKNVDNMNEPDIEIILNMFDKDKSTGILFVFFLYLLLLYIYYLKF